NADITVVIVRRQPFGGWKRSSVGRGAESGGAHDSFRFVRFRSTAPAPGAGEWYRGWWRRQFGVEIDRSGLTAEANVLRYRPVTGVIARIDGNTSDTDVESLRAASAVTGVPFQVSGPPGREGTADVVESDAALARRLAGTGAERMRLLARAGEDLLA